MKRADSVNNEPTTWEEFNGSAVAGRRVGRRAFGGTRDEVEGDCSGNAGRPFARRSE